MKKLLCVLLSVVFVLSFAGCTQSELPVSSEVGPTPTAQPTAEPTATPEPEATSAYPSREPVHHDWDGEGTLYPYGTVENMEGFFVFDKGVLFYPMNSPYITYLDFASGQVVPFCFRPSCQHTGNDCDALAANSSRWCFVANDKFYYLDVANARSVYNDDIDCYVSEVDLYVSALSRTSEKKVTSLQVSLMDSYPLAQLVLQGNSAFILHKVSRDMILENQGTEDDKYACQYLTEIDLLGDKAMRTVKVEQGSSASAYAYSAYGGGIYLLSSYNKEPMNIGTGGINIVNGKEMTDEELEQYIANNSMVTYYRYNIATGELETRESAYPDEYTGPIVNGPFTNALFPAAVVDARYYIVKDDTLKRYDIETGEEVILYDSGPVSDLIFHIGYSSNPFVYYDTNDDFVYLMDAAANDTVSTIPYLTDGENRIRVEQVLGWSDTWLYAQAGRLEPGQQWGESIYIAINMAHGFEDPQWEELTLTQR